MTEFGKFIRKGGVLAAITALQVSGPAYAADGKAAFKQAMEAYGAGGFALAESRLQTAAGHGEWRADEILGFMYTVGEPVYPGIDIDRTRAARHFASAAVRGSEASAYLLCALAKHTGADQPQAAACNRNATQTLPFNPADVPYESD